MSEAHDATAAITLRPRDCLAILRAARRIEDARLAAEISAIADGCDRAPLADNEDPREAAWIVRYLRALLAMLEEAGHKASWTVDAVEALSRQARNGDKRARTLLGKVPSALARVVSGGVSEHTEGERRHDRTLWRTAVEGPMSEGN